MTSRQALAPVEGDCLNLEEVARASTLSEVPKLAIGQYSLDIPKIFAPNKSIVSDQPREEHKIMSRYNDKNFPSFLSSASRMPVVKTWAFDI